jgi:hypothetical protein
VEAVDIYGLLQVPEQWSCVGSEFFARALPDGDWVWFDDLPNETCKALMKRIRARDVRVCISPDEA